MQTVTGTLEAHPARLTMALVLGSGFAIFGEERRDMVFDSSFVPPAKGKADGARYLYVVLDGTFQWIDGESFEGPSAFIAVASFFDGENGTRRASYRSGGPTFKALELRISGDELGYEGQEAPSRVSLTEDAFQDARNYIDALCDDERKAFALQFLTRIHLDGILKRELNLKSELIDVVYNGLWKALVPMFRKMSFGMTGSEVANLSEVSSRTMRVDLRRFASIFHFGFTGWREFARRHRLKLAVLFLSHPEVAIRDVAKAVGYSNTEAFTHALYAENLPAPGILRERILSCAAVSHECLTLPLTDSEPQRQTRASG